MNLGELVVALEAADPRLILPEGFTNPHSWRGDYSELAFEPARNVTVADMLSDAREALGATYQGWKGGDYTMSEYTDCWLAEEGTCWNSETIGPRMLQYMLAAGLMPDEMAEPEPDPSDPRQIAIDLIHQNIREGALRHVRIAVSEQYDLKELGRDGYAAKVAEVQEHIIRATVTVKIPDEVAP